MAFDPNEHLIKIGNKEYLAVAWRLVWFREVHPLGRIDTDVFTVGNMIAVKAIIADVDGHVLASGLSTVRDANQREATWAGRIIEKAETAAIGRALAAAGFGTQFTDDDEDEFLADAPVERKAKPSQSQAPAKPKQDLSPEQWDKDVMKKTVSFYTDAKHQKASIDKALRDKLINKDMSPFSASCRMLGHRIEVDYKLADSEVKSAISDALGMSLVEWLKGNNYDFKAAYEIVTQRLNALGNGEIPF